MALETIGVAAVVEGVGQFVGDLSKMEGAYDRTTGAIGKASRAVGDATQALGKLAIAGAAAAATAIGGLVVGLGKLAMEAGKVEGVAKTFDALAISIGSTTVEALEKLRVATRGMVSDTDLMLAGNKFMAMGLANSADEAAQLAEVATQLGLAMGEEAGPSMENFALMLANQSIPRLDSFGISSGVVRERILELMEATEGLTREEAFMTAVMEQAEVTMAKVGEQGDTSAATMARMGATFENVKLEIGKAFLPIMKVVMDLFSEAASIILPKVVDQLGVLAEVATNVVFYFDELVRGGSDANAMLEMVPDAIQPILQGLGEFITAVKEGVAVVQSGQGAFAGLMEILDNFLPDATIERIWELYDAIVPIIEQVADWLSENVELQDVLIALAVAIASVVVPAIVSVVSAAAPIVLVFAGLVAAAALLRKAWTEDWGGIQEKVAIVSEFIQEQWAKVTAFFEENMPLILETLAAFRQGGGELADFWENNVMPALEHVWEIIKEVVSVGVDVILNVLKIGMQIITGDWGGAWETIKETVGLIWESIKTIAGEFIEGVLNVIGTNMEGFKSSWEGVWDLVQQIVSTVWDNIKTGVETKVEEVRSAIETKIEEIESAWEGIWDNIQLIVETVWGNIVSGVEEKIQEVYDAITGKIEEIRTWIEGQVESFLSAGKSLIQGMIDGIGAMGNALWDAATAIAQNALDAILEALGIPHSPSPVYIEIGKSIGEGLVEGILSTAADVQDAISGLFGAAGVVGGLGATAARLLRKRQLDPLTKSLKLYGKELKQATAEVDAFIEANADILGIRPGDPRFQERVAAEQQRDVLLRRQVDLQNKINDGQAEQARLQEKLLALEKQREDIAFLQQQVALLDLIRERGLDAEQILAGMELGVNASLENVLDAMTRALQEIVTQTEAELGITSPSKVFERLGGEIMAGLAIGMHNLAPVAQAQLQQALLPMMGPQPVIAGSTSTFNLNVGSVNTGMDVATLQAMMRQTVREMI